MRSKKSIKKNIELNASFKNMLPYIKRSLFLTYSEGVVSRFISK